MAVEPKHVYEEDEISMKEMISNFLDWIAYFWSKWLFLLLTGILGGALGLCYAILKAPTYTATTTFVLESGETKNALSQYAGMAALVGIDISGGMSGLFQGDNILELYRSRKMLESTLLSKVHPDSGKLLIDQYIAFSGLRESWANEPFLSTIDFHKDPTQLDPRHLRIRDSIITRVVKDINDGILNVTKPDKKLSIFKVEVTSGDEMFSKIFNENLVRQVNGFYVRTKTKNTTDNISILEQKVDSVRTAMERAIFSAAKISDATPNLNPTRQVQRVAPVQEAQFSAEANKAILSHLLQNLELTKLNLLQEQPLIQQIDEPVYPLKVNKVNKVNGIVIGGVILGFISMLYLIFIKWYRQVMASDRGEIRGDELSG